MAVEVVKAPMPFLSLFQEAPAACRKTYSFQCVVLSVMLSACTADAPADAARVLQGATVAPLTAEPVAAQGLERHDALFDGRLALIGTKILPASLKVGDVLEGTMMFRVEDPPGTAPDLKVFVHAVAPGGKMPLVQADHRITVDVPPAQWRRGDILMDTFSMRLPTQLPTDRLELRVGLYEGRNRWSVDRGQQDGDQRVTVARLEVDGGKPAFPEAKAKKRTAAIVIDGQLDEADWQRAERLGPFENYSGRGRIKHPTYARIVWDEEALYLAFECTDPDIHTPYKKRDDPLYNSEAVEIFIDADGDKDEYVELQAAPNDLHFDASFKGGSRKGFDTSWNHDYETRASIEGTLNNESDKDTRWVSEWRIPITGLKDIPRTPTVGDAWKINLFRLDRRRRAGKVRGSEATAWSSPYSGDFHNLERFGTLRFVD